MEEESLQTLDNVWRMEKDNEICEDLFLPTRKIAMYSAVLKDVTESLS